MQRWLVIAGIAPLLAATAANAQVSRPFDTREPAPAPRAPSVNFRLVQEPSLNRVDPPSTGWQADTAVGPNARLGFRMITVSRPKLGPEWRMDGRAVRSRKPAVSFSLRF